jgi:hypothetical protein
VSKSSDRSGIMSVLTDEQYIEHLARSITTRNAQYEKLVTGAVRLAEEHIEMTAKAENITTGRREGTDTTRSKAKKKEIQWIAEYKKVKAKNPTWKIGSIWDEVASQLEDTPYKGNARYMQNKIKILPD